MTGAQLALELRQDIEAIDHADGEARREAAPGELGTPKVYFAYRDAGIDARLLRLEGWAAGETIDPTVLQCAAAHAVIAFELCVYAALINPEREELTEAIRRARSSADKLIEEVAK